MNEGLLLRLLTPPWHPPQESEDMRGMFVNTNPVLLYTTVGVSALHLLFDVLAFKNDVSFWRSVDTMEGLSSRSLVLNQIMEFVILLYLHEQARAWCAGAACGCSVRVQRAGAACGCSVRLQRAVANVRLQHVVAACG